MINGAILSVGVAAAVWLLLRLTPRRSLNATTRYAVWWATLLLIFCLSIPLHFQPERTPASIAAPRMIGSIETAPIVIPLKVGSAPWIRWTLIAWLGLSLLLLMRLIASYRSLHNRRRRAIEAPLDLRARTETWLRLRRGARLAISSEVSTPAAVGPWEPAILIPAKLLMELRPEELDHIILHETAHLARLDDIVLLLQRIIEALLPLHPVVRWITRQIDVEREIACDDFVVEMLQSPRSYARCLTRVMELSGNVRGSLASPTAVDSLSQLARRINMLLDRTCHTGTRLRKVRLGAIVAALALFGWMGGRMPGVVSFAMAQATQVVAPPAPPPQPQPRAVDASTTRRQTAPSATAPPLYANQDPELKALSYRFGWEIGYLQFAKHLEPDEIDRIPGTKAAFEVMLREKRPLTGTNAEQQAALATLRDRLRRVVDALTAARREDERQ